MRKKELQNVIELIHKYEFTAREIEVENNDIYTKLIFLPNPKLYFLFKIDDNNFESFGIEYIRYEPKLKKQTFANYKKFKDAVISLDWWLTPLKDYLHEMSLPDPLEKYQGSIESNSFANIDDYDNAPFTDREKLLIEESVKKFQNLLEQNFDLTEQGKGFVKDKLSKLIEPTERLNKGEWKAFAIKVMYDIGISLVSNAALSIGAGLISTHIPPIFWNIVREAFTIIAR